MKILLTDDDKDGQIHFCDAVNLTSPGIACYPANSGHDGISLLNAYRFLLQCTFLISNLPLMNGQDTFKVIQPTPELSGY